MSDPNDGELLKGQSYEDEFDVAFPYTEQEVSKSKADSLIGQNRKEITPINKSVSRVRNLSPDINILANYKATFPGSRDITLPDVLTSIRLVWSADAGSGSSSETGSGNASGSNLSLSLNLEGSAQGSASVTGDIIPEIKQFYGQNIPTKRLYFFQINPTIESIVDRLTTIFGAPVTAWPRFQPVAHTIIITGGSVSIQAHSSAQQHITIDTDLNFSQSNGVGSGYSKQISKSIRTIRIPPTIHGVISITEEHDQLTLTKTASAAVALAIARGTGGWGEFNSPSNAPSLDVVGSITPTNLNATSPPGIPTSGLYLYNSQVDPYKYGFSKIVAEVVDAANLA